MFLLRQMAGLQGEYVFTSWNNTNVRRALFYCRGNFVVGRGCFAAQHREVVFTAGLILLQGEDVFAPQHKEDVLLQG